MNGTEQHPKGSGLATAVRTQNSIYRPPLYMQVNTIHSSDRAVVFGKCRGVQDCFQLHAFG